MSKHKKRVSLANRVAEAEATAEPLPAQQETVPVEAVEAPNQGGEPEAAQDIAQDEAGGRGIESHPLFWFTMGALTVGIIVLLGLLIMNPAPKAAAKVPASSAQGASRSVTATVPKVTTTLPTTAPATTTKPPVTVALAATARPTVTIPPTPDLAPTWTAVAWEHASVPRISVDEAKRLLDAGDAIIVDVRYPESYKAGHIKGAINIPEPDTEQRLSEFPKDKNIILYCS